jgi:Zn-dependent peptidase ImmA (M78 family)
MRDIDYARSLYKYVDIENPPIIFTPIFDVLNIRLVEDEGLLASAVLTITDDFNLIVVNTSYPRTKQRFSIAHEIGHLVMKHHRSTFKCHNENSPMERSANRFAAELLMPIPTVKKLWDEYVANPENRIELIASKLDVSKAALRSRIRGLGLR